MADVAPDNWRATRFDNAHYLELKQRVHQLKSEHQKVVKTQKIVKEVKVVLTTI